MKTKKRYAVTVNYYVWAENENEAIKIANKNCKNQDEKNDDKCSLVIIDEIPFGRILKKIQC